MAKDFGMEFETRFGKWEIESLPHIAGAGYRLYIHADSLHLLEPRVGDAIIWRNPVAFDCDWRWTIMDSRPVHPDNEFRIVQRDGKAFIWPEVEP
jgi:hypothetical protein